MCSISDIKNLEIDHPKCDGVDDRKRFPTDISFYKYYIAHPEEAKERLRILCPYCNRVYTTRLGMQRARLQGKTIGRPISIINRDQLIELLTSGMPRERIAKELGISKATLYKTLRELHIPLVLKR